MVSAHALRTYVHTGTCADTTVTFGLPLVSEVVEKGRVRRSHKVRFTNSSVNGYSGTQREQQHCVIWYFTDHLGRLSTYRDAGTFLGAQGVVLTIDYWQPGSANQI